MVQASGMVSRCAKVNVFVGLFVYIESKELSFMKQTFIPVIGVTLFHVF